VKEAIGHDPWLSFPTLPAVYFAGTKPASLTPEQQLELTFWLSVKDSTSPAVLATYLERYPNEEFAAIALTLAEHYDRKLKAEQAAQEEERKRIEEERKAAEVKRLEEEERMREVAIAEERKRLDESKSSEEARRLEGQQRAELIARAEEPRKAMEEARLAREAARSAEEQRVAAIKSAEEANKAANDAISIKRDTERHTALIRLRLCRKSTNLRDRALLMALGSSPGSDRTAAKTGIAFRLLSRATFHTERREEVQFKDPSLRQEIFVSRIHHRQVPAVTIIPAHCAEGVAREHLATIREGAVEHSRQAAVHRCRS
jgi:hypothetical protein